MFKKLFSFVAVLALVASAQAAMLEITPTAPQPAGDDIANLVGCTTDANNVGTPEDPPYANDATTYVAMDRGGQGQTFVTGEYSNGYLVTGVWVKHVSYTGSTDQTWYRMQPGGVLQIRITDPAAAGTDAFVLASETYTITGTEPNALPTDTTNTQTGTGLWFHVTLDTPVKLAANMEYGFDLTSLSGVAGILFFETDGTSGDPYAAGAAYVTGANGVADNNMTVAPGDHVFVVELEPALPKVAWVSFHTTDLATANAATAGFVDAPDKGYTDLLTANGYAVTRVLQTGNPDPNLLNAFDVVIISRSCASTSFQGANADNWNTKITAPIINLGAYTLRKNRSGLYTGNTIPDTAGDIKLTVVDPTHPIFAGIELDANSVTVNNYAGICTYPDGVTIARGISIVTEPIDDEGKLLATIDIAPSAGAAPVAAAIVAEFLPGTTVVHDGGAGTNVLAGHQLIFLTGSREANGMNSEGTGMIDLTPDGQTMFLNAVAYMLQPLPPKEIEVVNASFELPGTVKQNAWDGGTNAKGTFVDVPGWNSDTMATDSGVESDSRYPATDGVWTGFLKAGDPSVWNTTSYLIVDGDEFTLSVDARNNYTATPPALLTLSLYCDAFGTRLTLATTTVEVTADIATYTLVLPAADAGIVAGMPIGIELTNASAPNSWIGIDNVHLTVPY